MEPFNDSRFYTIEKGIGILHPIPVKDTAIPFIPVIQLPMYS